MDLYFIRRNKIIVIDSELVSEVVPGFYAHKLKKRKTKLGPTAVMLGSSYPSFNDAYWALINIKQAEKNKAYKAFEAKQDDYDRALRCETARRIK